MPEGAETENTAEGTQEDSLPSLEQEYNNIFNSLKTTYQAFVNSYLESYDSKKAATAAGYSSKSAVKQGSRLCRNKNISLLVSLRQRINSLRGKITTAWVLEELKTRYERCVGEGKEQAATANLNLIGQHLSMFGKGKDEGKGDLHLHKHKYVNYPPVPESIQAWVDQMREVGYEAALPVKEEDDETNRGGGRATKDVSNVPVVEHVTPVTSEGKDE